MNPRRTPEEARRAAVRAETVGILVFALVAFIVILVRYGRFLDWHAR